jgi:hypothetical protein
MKAHNSVSREPASSRRTAVPKFAWNAVEQPRRSILLLLVAVALACALLVPLPARAQAQGLLGGYMQLSTIADGQGTYVFGPGQTVAIDGVIPFVFVCPSMYSTGKNVKPTLQIYPVADFYVMLDTGTPLQPGDQLKDINGSPETVIGTSDGSFVDAIVAITKPAGNTGAGKYRIVMDACQTGVYDPQGGDIVLGDAYQIGFVVQEPAVLPPIDLSPIKTNASQYLSTLEDVKIAGIPVAPGACSLFKKVGGHTQLGSILAGWFETALAYCADLIGEYQGLAADPPDPNYQTFAELGNINYASYSASTPLERATRTLANAMADQDAASNAFLNSLQKFQGAQAAGDDEWTMLQLTQMNKFINLLIGPGGSMLRTYAALEAFNIALQQDPLGTTQDAQNLEAFLPTLRQTLGAMLTPLGGFFQPYFDSTGNLQLRPVGLQAYIQVYLGQSGDPINLPGIPQERALAGLPPIALPYPTASTGGNHNAAPGATVTFNAGKSTDPGGSALTYAWDFNGNGAFTDATGVQPQYSYSQPGTRTIGVKVTDSNGFTNIAYALANIGDVNSQDIIAMPISRQIYDIHPDGSYSTISPGLPYNVAGLVRMQVDVTGDIWVLDSNAGLQQYDSNGNLLATITRAQVGSLTGIPLLSLNDFAIDGSGRIVLIATQDLGAGYLNFGFGQYYTELPGRSKLIRLAADGSSAAYLDDLNQPYLSLQTVNGVLTEYVDVSTSCYGNPGFVRVDPTNGNIIVSNVNNSVGADGGRAVCSDGLLSINPKTAVITPVIPTVACDGYGCASLTDPNYGTYYYTDLTFAGSSLHVGNYGGWAPQAAGLFVLDAQGNYIIAPLQGGGGLRVGRVDVPPQITNNGGTLDVDTFPVSVHGPGTIYLTLNAMTVDAGGNYVGVGSDYAGILSGDMFRITPDGQVFTVAAPTGPFGLLAAVDVVPQVRPVTPSDMPPPPSVVLSNLTVAQTSCPGSAQLNVTVHNTGSTPTPLPVQVFFYDGDPSLGNVVGTATTSGPLPAGGTITLSAPWASPAPSTHQMFALTLGVNPVNVTYIVCVPSQYAANPLVLSPPSGSTTVGNPYTVTAQLVDSFGGAISGASITFQVSGANSAMGTVTTDANGNAQFSYSGTNPGVDNIVATSLNVTSNAVTDTWQGAPTPPVVTPPASISIPATQAGGATPNASPALAAFLAGATATSSSGPAPTALPPQVGGVPVTATTLFPVGTTTVTFSFQGSNGNVGSGTSTVTVSIGVPRITGSIAGVGNDPSGAVYVNVVLTNTGTGNARNLAINSFIFRTLSGTGTVTYNSALSPPLPISIGNLDVGNAVTTRVYLNIPSTVKRVSITESGPVQDVLGTNYNYSTAEAFVP